MTTSAPSPTQDVSPVADDNDPRFSHIVRRDDQMRGYVGGEPIVALCGKTWVPTRDPDRYPLCPRCKQTMDQLTAGQRGQN